MSPFGINGNDITIHNPKGDITPVLRHQVDKRTVPLSTFFAKLSTLLVLQLLQ